MSSKTLSDLFTVAIGTLCFVELAFTGYMAHTGSLEATAAHGIAGALAAYVLSHR